MAVEGGPLLPSGQLSMGMKAAMHQAEHLEQRAGGHKYSVAPAQVDSHGFLGAGGAAELRSLVGRLHQQAPPPIGVLQLTGGLYAIQPQVVVAVPREPGANRPGTTAAAIQYQTAPPPQATPAAAAGAQAVPGPSNTSQQAAPSAQGPADHGCWMNENEVCRLLEEQEEDGSK